MSKLLPSSVFHGFSLRKVRDRVRVLIDEYVCLSCESRFYAVIPPHYCPRCGEPVRGVDDGEANTCKLAEA